VRFPTSGLCTRRLLAVALSIGALLAVAAPEQAGAVPSEATGHLSGVVEDAQGVLLAGANVSLTDASGQTAATAVGDDHGHYDVAVAPGTYTLVADARSGGTPLHVTVPSVAVGPATPLDVVIAGRPGGLVQFRGRLVDSSGSPLSGATLGLEGDTWTVTDPGGHFALAVPPGVYNQSVSLPDGGGPFFWLHGLDLTRDRVGDITLALVTHDVTVRDSSGAPVERAWVTIRPTDDAGLRDWYDWGATDAGGHVRLTGLSTSNLTVDVSPPGGSDQVSKSGIDGRRSTTLGVTLPAPTSLIRLTGTTTDADGVTPLYPSVSLSDAKSTKIYGSQRVYYPEAGPGAFTLDAPVGTYTLKLSTSAGPGDEWPGGDPTRDAYDLSSEQFRNDQPRHVAFRLPLGPGLTVRVLDPQGAPVAGARLTARSTAPPGSTDFELAPGLRGAGTLDTLRVTDADGVATLRTLPGHLPTTVHVVAPSERGLEGDFAVPVGATGLDVHLDRGVVASGTIHVGSRPGSPAYHVTLVSKDGKVQRPVSVGADGTYRVSVAPGTYRVETDNNDDEPGGESDDHWNATTSSSTFTVTGDRRLDLTFPETSGASVRFVGADGNPLEGEIFLESATDPGAIVLAPGITTTASAWFSAFGERDSAGIDTWPGGATVSGGLDYDSRLLFSGVRLAPGGAAVIALAQGYSLVRPDPPAGLTAVAGGDGSATIAWDQSANGHGHPIVGYYVQLSSDEYDRTLVVAAPATCTTVTGLLPNTRYRISVSAMTERGVGESGSSAVLVTPEASAPNLGAAPACPPPGTPTGSASPPDANPSESAPSGFRPSITPGPSGYWMLGSDGKVYTFGNAPQLGNGNADAVDVEPTPTGKGYWILSKGGTVQAFGDATNLGDVDRGKLAKGEEPASLSATPTGRGYWVFTNRGRAVAFGDAPHLGDMSQTKLNGPVLGSVATPTGKGYYMVASDGGIFAFGDARFAGSMGGKKLNAPVQSLVPDSDGLGYWLVASDGGIFAFDAPFRGSMGGTKLNKPVSGMVRYGDGYLMVGADGGIFNFSSLPFSGSLGDKPPASPVVAVAALPSL
jgi:carboxypeptidase family protein/fibronectin type III domain protein